MRHELEVGGLESLRGELEELDRRIIDELAARAALARRIGREKRANGLPTLDPAREAAVVRQAGELARAAGLPEEEVRQIYWQIVALCRRAQLEEQQ